MKKGRKNYKGGGGKNKKKNFNSSNNNKVNKNGKKVNNFQSKNLKHIIRSQEAESALRRQKEIESKYENQHRKQQESSGEEDEEEEINPLDQLMSIFKQSEGNDAKSKHLMSIESSSESSENEEELDDVEDVLDKEDEIDDESNDDNDMESLISDEELIQSSDESINEDEELVQAEEEEEENIAEDENDIESENEEIGESEDEEDNDKSNPNKIIDPFFMHLKNDLSSEILEVLTENSITYKKSELNWPKLGRLEVEIPQAEKTTKLNNVKKLTILDEEQIYAAEGKLPQLLDKTINLNQLQIKIQIQRHMFNANKINLNNEPSSTILTSLQSEMFSIINNYQDLYYPQRSFDNADQIRFTYCMHILNHILKTRTEIVHNNSQIAKLTTIDSSSIIPDEYRDQGLVRPKVLIILPFKDAAYKVINQFIDLLLPDNKGRILNLKRFEEEFTGEELAFSKRNPKPEDYEKTFSGNTNDTFRIGITLTKKAIKLYSDFYSSDILIASPLGLRMIIGAKGDEERDYDFLASIELLILDQTEIFLAQNWDHLIHVFEHMHLQPQAARNTDFSRVRSWCLSGLARFYRQTLLFASHDLPDFRALFNHRCANYRGKIKIINPIVVGTIRHVAVQIPQIFHKIEVTSLEKSFDTRYEFFINKMLPQFKGPSMAHCLIYIPSYFDYVRIRNYFKKETMNFVQICEYSKEGKIARARDMFFHSSAHFLIYSERAHFFRRIRIKGIRHLIIYQPPSWPQFYPEIINLMQEANQNPRDGLSDQLSVTVLYTKYDVIQIASIIGTERAAKIIQSDKPTHMFMTGD